MTPSEVSRNRAKSRLFAKIRKFQGSGRYYGYLTPSEIMMLVSLGLSIPKKDENFKRTIERVEIEKKKGISNPRTFYFNANAELSRSLDHAFERHENFERKI